MFKFGPIFLFFTCLCYVRLLCILCIFINLTSFCKLLNFFNIVAMLYMIDEFSFVSQFLFWYFNWIYFVSVCLLAYYKSINLIVAPYLYYTIISLLPNLSCMYVIYCETFVMILYPLFYLWAIFIFNISVLFAIKVHFLFSSFIWFYWYAWLALSILQLCLHLLSPLPSSCIYHLVSIALQINCFGFLHLLSRDVFRA